jgi:hypothetical protein
MNRPYGWRQTIREVVRLFVEHPIPVIVVLTVAIIQVLATLFPLVHSFVQSYVGAFSQAVLVTLAFGRITAQTWRRRRLRIEATRLLLVLRRRLGRGESLECEDLRAAFFRIRLISVLRQKEWGEIESSSSLECAIFILGFQYYGKSFSNLDIDASRLTEIAARAAELRDYRIVLLVGALRHVADGDQLEELAHQIETKASRRFPVSPKNAEADLRFETLLSQASGDRLFVLSTTSQTSGFGYGFVRRHERNLSEVSVVHLSPRIHAHPAVLHELAELRVPKQVIPINQQIPDETADAVRRVIRIVVGVSELWKSFGDSSIKLSTLAIVQQHPSVKVRALESSSYLQIFPGDLNYAANLYRTGYELVDSELVSRIMTMIHSWVDKNAVCCSNASESDDLTRRAIAELGRWLTGVPDAVGVLSRWYPQHGGRFQAGAASGYGCSRGRS